MADDAAADGVESVGTDARWGDFIVVRVPAMDTVASDAIRRASRSAEEVDAPKIVACLVELLGSRLGELSMHRPEFSAGELDEFLTWPDFDYSALQAFLSTKGAVGIAVNHKLATFMRDVVPTLLAERVHAGEFDRLVGGPVPGDVGRSNDLRPGATTFARDGRQYVEVATDAVIVESRKEAGLPPYPRAEWATDRWWAPAPSKTETSRDLFTKLWVRRSSPPKPRVKEYGDEVRGWSGLLADNPWVRSKYGATAMILAKTDTSLDSPEAWNTVSRFYADYVDSLARFSASFAVMAHEYRPAGLPSMFTGAVKCYEWQVPPHVRRGMSGAPQPDHTGGVVEVEGTTIAFCADPDRHVNRYRPMALRKYASVLIEKLSELEAPPDVVRNAFQDAVARLAPFGDPDQPHRRATPREERHVEALLAHTISRDSEVRNHPALEVAYARAQKTMVRWLIEGRELKNATILYKKLESARLDAVRHEARLGTQESPHDPVVLAATSGADDSDEIGRVHDRDVLARARVRLAEYPAPAPDEAVDCWEKRCALDLLDDAARVLPQQPGLRAVAIAAWKSHSPPGRRTKPPGAKCTSATAAAGYMLALLYWAVSSVASVHDVPGVIPTESALEAIARRCAEVDEVLGLCQAPAGPEEG